MEYYDSINKKEFHQYYLEKSNKLLRNQTIIKLLETKNDDYKTEPTINYGSVKKMEPTTDYSSVKTIPAVKRKSVSNLNLPIVNPNDDEAKIKFQFSSNVKNFVVDPKVIQ